MRSAQQEWERLLINANFSKVLTEPGVIAWPNYSTGVRIPDFVTLAPVKEAASQGQYSFKISLDDALLRLEYRFDPRGRELRSAHLGYYRVEQSFRKDDVDNVRYAEYSEGTPGIAEAMIADYTITDGTIMDEELEVVGETIEASDSISENVAWLRLDFDPHQKRGPLHSSCHLHICGLPSARMIVYGVPTPRQFIDFIFAIAYPDIYRRNFWTNLAKYEMVNDSRISTLRR